MTIVVGAVDDRGAVWMGADSQGSNGWDRTIRRDQKVFRVGSYLMGFTSSYRMGQVLRYKLAPPEPPCEGDLFGFMVVDFVDHVRAAFKSAGFCKTENGVESGGDFLVGVCGRLFRIEGDYQVGESEWGYSAVGCGAAYALGAMAVSRGTTEERIRAALGAAIQFSNGCGGPCSVLSVGVTRQAIETQGASGCP
jgi:ATP-dependent protease HslVU (ClpYQ) peptidase subunit